MSLLSRLEGKSDIRAAVSAHRAAGRRVALVPTMGALHDGHLSLVREGLARADVVVVSIFVNPTQFGPGEDFERYPRTLEADLRRLQDAGASIAFVPPVAEMYADDASVTVDPGPLASRWEGEVRPGHFTGVATIVTKLLSAVRPDVACFGEKDFQQLRIIERLSLDLDLGVEIVGCPIVREPDGLALSSRNAYLSAQERTRALSLWRALAHAQELAQAGERSSSVVEAAMRSVLDDVGGKPAIDYAAVIDPLTLDPVERIEPGSRAIIAARIGATRLIDNIGLLRLPG